MMDDTDLFLRMGVALAIGLMVGMERGWQTREVEDRGRAAGFRTYGLTGLMGGIAGHLALLLNVQLLGIAFVAFTAAFTAFHWIEATAHKTASVTSVVAGMLTFLLGALAVVGNERLAIASAVAMTVLLSLREPLHRWIGRISWDEIKAGLILAVMSFLLLPILPDRAIDPWGAVNPHEIWLLAIMIALISMAGYILVKLFGDQLGIILTAAAGGLASSTATTLTLARLGAGRPGSASLLAGGIAISGTVMTIRVAAIVLFLNNSLAGVLWQPLAAAALTQAACALVMIRASNGHKPESSGAGFVVANPLELGTSLKFAGLIAVIMLLVEVVRQTIGNVGLLVVAALSGLADVDAISISLARTEGVGDVAGHGILIAVAVNTMTKAVLAGWIGGRGIGLRMAATTALALGVGAAVFFLA